MDTHLVGEEPQVKTEPSTLAGERLPEQCRELKPQDKPEQESLPESQACSYVAIAHALKNRHLVYGGAPGSQVKSILGFFCRYVNEISNQAWLARADSQ